MFIIAKLPNGNKIARHAETDAPKRWLEVYTSDGLYKGLAIPKEYFSLPVSWPQYVLADIAADDFRLMLSKLGLGRCEGAAALERCIEFAIAPYDKDPFESN